MSDINTCTFTARLGKDPELRATPGGQQVVNFRVAISERYKDGSGERQERTLWLGVVAWGKLAETCSQYLQKGSRVAVSGRLQSRQWEDKDGQQRETFELVLANMTMLDTKPRDEDQRAAEQAPARQRKPAAQQQGAPFDDDIPF